MVEISKSRAKRIEQLERIEKYIGGPVLVYFTADSPITGGRIGEDAPLPMFEHLLTIGKQKRLALYLYSPGGVMETPWKIVTMLREFCEELHVVVPYKAYSGATMVAMGADKIHMTRKAELGPIDPSLQVPVPQEGSGPQLPDLGVEDVSAFVTFMRERAKITDQDATAQVIGTLAQYLTPPLLGRLERIRSHIRLVARNLLTLHQPPLDDARVSAITEALTEKIYVHGHGIGRREARHIGLDIEFLDGNAERPVWDLYKLYEPAFRLSESMDVESYFPADSDVYERPDTAVACIESTTQLAAFVGTIRAQRIRRLPSNPTINVNLELNIPPNVQAQQLPQAIQQAVQQLLQQAVQQLNQLVAKEIQRQSPQVAVSASLRGGVWKKLA